MNVNKLVEKHNFGWKVIRGRVYWLKKAESKITNYNYSNQYELLLDAYIENNNKVVKEVYYNIVINDIKRENEI